MSGAAYPAIQGKPYLHWLIFPKDNCWNSKRFLTFNLIFVFSDVLPTLTMDSDTQKLKKNIGSMVERLNKGAKLSHSSSGELFYYFIEFSFVILHCICISFYISCLSHFFWFSCSIGDFRHRYSYKKTFSQKKICVVMTIRYFISLIFLNCISLVALKENWDNVDDVNTEKSARIILYAEKS